MGPGLLKNGLSGLLLSCITLTGLKTLLSKYPRFLSSGDLESLERRLCDVLSPSELWSVFDLGLRPFGGEPSLDELGPGGQWDKTTRSRFSIGEDLCLLNDRRDSTCSFPVPESLGDLLASSSSLGGDCCGFSLLGSSFFRGPAFTWKRLFLRARTELAWPRVPKSPKRSLGLTFGGTLSLMRDVALIGRPLFR